MIQIVSRNKGGRPDRQSFLDALDLIKSASGAPYAWYEREVHLVIQGRAVLYSSLGSVNQREKLTMQGVVHWFQETQDASKAEIPCAVLHGSREIQQGDFRLMPDAADWTQMPDDEREGWAYLLTPNCNMDEILGTHVETVEKDDTLDTFLYVEPGYDAVLPVLYIDVTYADGRVQTCKRPLSDRECEVLLELIRSYEADRLRSAPWDTCQMPQLQTPQPLRPVKARRKKRAVTKLTLTPLGAASYGHNGKGAQP